MAMDSKLSILHQKMDELLDMMKEQEKERSVSNDSKVKAEHIPPPNLEIRQLELWKKVIFELLGTMCYIFFVCGVNIPWTGHFAPFLSVAFASAFAYGAITTQVFPGSHLNPAFTLALAVTKCISPLRFIVFGIAQMSGAIAGTALLYSLTIPGYVGTLGGTTIASHVSPVQAFGMEFILSFVITLTFMADPSRTLPTTFVLLAANLVALPCTGAGLNPVRSLGPAFVMNKWTNHWVFWLGPILGSLLAAYMHKYILKRIPKKGKKGRERESTSDGDSLDIQLPTAVIPTTATSSATHERFIAERIEPLYSGTRSLYMKPSPVLPRTNLSRSQSVYASKRLEYNPPKFETLRKQTTPHSSGPHSNSHSHSHHNHHHHHGCGDSSNYESLYDRKPCPVNGPSGVGNNLLISGPPSYESGYYKSYEISEKSHNRIAHHRRDPSSDVRDNHANRILAQYETSKGLVDLDFPKAGVKSHNNNKSSLFYESEYSAKDKFNGEKSGNSNSNTIDKKLIDTSSPATRECEHPPPPPRFRMQTSSQNHQRYQPSGQEQISGNDLSQNHNHHHNHNSGGHGAQVKELSTFPRKPYELLDNPTRKLLDFSPNHSQPNSTLPTPNSIVNSHASSPNYNANARLLMNHKDSAYQRILEPLMNSKPLPSGNRSNNGSFCTMSPNDQMTYSYH